MSNRPKCAQAALDAAAKEQAFDRAYEGWKQSERGKRPEYPAEEIGQFLAVAAQEAGLMDPDGLDCGSCLVGKLGSCAFQQQGTPNTDYVVGPKVNNALRNAQITPGPKEYLSSEQADYTASTPQEEVERGVDPEVLEDIGYKMPA